MIKLGLTVKDKITDFEGIAISRTEFIYSTPRIGVQGKIDSDGHIPVMQSFEEEQLEVINEDLRKVGFAE